MDIVTDLPDYQITEELYASTHTRVYRAIHRRDRVTVVIKVLRNEYPNFSELVQFRNQYTIAKNLDFPHIIKPLSLHAYHNSYALVMEDFGGISLCKYLDIATDKSHPYTFLPLIEFLKIAIKLTETLHYLYQNRVIHKDIKPANILINPDTKEVKLIDFSISSLLPRETQEIQNPNILEGTLTYISPEQTGRMNRGIDYRSDFYSFGVTCYQLLTGKPPFESSDVMELVHCHLAKKPIPIHKINPNIPMILSEIIGKLMEKNAEDRYQSALGIKHDLEICLTQLQTQGQIDSFEIGQQDISDRFIIPEKLYGREREVKQLLNAFERVNMNSTEMMLVAGFSGIGKTAVINEVHKPIVRQRGYFIKGKYDQFNQHIPLGAFVQALRDLIGQLLSESDAQIQTWKTKIIEAIGENGQVLIEVIPELENIIGKQPPALELSGTAAQNRFNLLFQKFVQVFTRQEHPLVVFLDDLQWSDSASLNLLKLLMQDSLGYLLILGAYRDNEVSPVHPFILTVNEMLKSGATIHTLTLPSLTQPDLNQLVADTINCELPLAQPLTKLIYQKTQGNPFFTTQFLKVLQAEKLIDFNWKTQHWQCDIAQIEALSLTDDVVEFMAWQLQKLATDTQEVMKLAACIGAEFDLNTLSIISEKSAGTTAKALWEALQKGLVIPTTKIYKFFTETDREEVLNASMNPTYRFLHDRVQQAAYCLIAPEEKQTTHFNIGTLLLQNFSLVEREERIFEIVNHLDIGKSLMTQARQQEELAQLNLLAGIKAKASTAYADALNYIATAIELLPTNAWENHYDLSLTLFKERAELEYFQGNFEAAEYWLQEALNQAKLTLEKAEIYNMAIVQYTMQARYPEAIHAGRQALALVNIDLPEENLDQARDSELVLVQAALKNRQFSDLVHLPMMTEIEPKMAIKLLIAMGPPTYRSHQRLWSVICAKAVNLCLQYGNTPEIGYIYPAFGGLRGYALNDYENTNQLIDVTLELMQVFNHKSAESVAYLMIGSSLRHWSHPLKIASEDYLSSYRVGLESSNLQYAAYAFGHNMYCRFYQSVFLEKLLSEITESLAFSRKYKNQWAIDLFLGGQILLAEWIGNTTNLKESDYLQQCHDHKNWQVICIFNILKSQLLFVHEQWEKAWYYSEQADAEIVNVAPQGLLPYVHHCFIHTLLLIKRYPTLPQEQKKDGGTKIYKYQQQLEIWAKNNPVNFLYLSRLVNAEMNRISGNFSQAIEDYDQAIASAKVNGSIQGEALGNELATQFYLAWGKEKVAAGYCTEAYYCYAKWGAQAKVTDLEKRYPQLLMPMLQQSHPPDLLEETITQGIKMSTYSSSSMSEVLDLTTLLKASQAISSEIELQKILATLLEIVITNAGANKGVLLLKQEIEFKVAALLEDGRSPQILPSVALDLSLEVPINIINNVKRNLKPIVLGDARVSNRFIADPYIQKNRPKSIICVPIIHLGQLTGILYLENNLAIGAFTSDRVELLKFLCSQAAISLENGRLYQESQTYAQQLEQSLEKLQVSESRYRYLATATSQIIWLANSQGENLDTVHWIAYTGQTQEEVKGTGWLNALHPDDLEHTTELWLQAVETKSLYRTEYRIRGVDGIYRYFDVQGVPILSTDGSVKEWIGTCADIDARKRAEDNLRQKSQELERTLQELQTMQLQLVQNEKMSALGNLVAGIAHEINNPVSFLKCNIPPILNYIKDLLKLIDLYQTKYSQPDADIQAETEAIELDYIKEDLPKLIGSMREGVKRIQDISVSLRTFSRADSDRPIACNIHDGIDSTLMILKHRLKANEKRPEIQVIKDYGSLPQFQCYAGQLNQVFMNILSNAIDALEQSNQGRSYGEIHNQILIKTELSSDQKQVMIRIKDNGIGMSSEVQKQVFDHLFTTKGVGKGTGLGLAIARQIIVEKHSGIIEVSSSLGEGTEFMISIPC